MNRKAIARAVLPGMDEMLVRDNSGLFRIGPETACVLCKRPIRQKRYKVRIVKPAGRGFVAFYYQHVRCPKQEGTP